MAREIGFGNSPPSPRPSPPGEGEQIVAATIGDDSLENPATIKSARRGNNFPLSPGERAGVRASVLQPFEYARTLKKDSQNDWQLVEFGARLFSHPCDPSPSVVKISFETRGSGFVKVQLRLHFQASPADALQ
jgi:hypothetical protein